jgi:hypothetical protein
MSPLLVIFTAAGTYGGFVLGDKTVALDPAFEAKVRALIDKQIEQQNADAYHYSRLPGASNYNLYKRHGAEADSLRAGTDAFLAQIDQGGIGEDKIQLIQQAIGSSFATGSLGMQGISELVASKAQLDKQNQQLSDFRNKAETQLFGGTGRTIQQALADPNSELGGLGEFLKGQQSDVFQSNLRPMIEMQLGSRGLMDSGANVELQSKALGDLERSRQSTLMNAGLMGKEGIRSLERSDILGDIGSQQAALSNLFDLQRTGITMEFERDLSKRREDLARELSSISNSGPSELQQILGGVGMAGSIAAAPFTGGMSLAALPSFTGMTFGGAGGQAGAGMAALGQSFYSGSGGGGSYGGGSMPKYGGGGAQSYYLNEFRR